MNVYIYDKEYLDLSFIQINEGDHVVLKPNLVKESKENDPGEWECVITSPWLIQQVCEYVASRLNGHGYITICDAPQSDSDFNLIRQRARLDEIAEQCRQKYKILVEILDLRSHVWVNSNGVVQKRQSQTGDPNGKIRFILNEKSYFWKHPGNGQYYGADYNAKELNQHHSKTLQEYLICATPIQSDVFINLPKMKTHKKTGVTLSLKNLVGINADKNWLPHHTCASRFFQGDEYPCASFWRKLEHKCVMLVRFIADHIPGLGTLIAQIARKSGEKIFGDGHQTIRSGNWYGNDTTWRMVLDLNCCLLRGNMKGQLEDQFTRRYYSIIDGLIGMEGEGPMQGNAKEVGLLIGGADPVAVDLVVSRLMGFDWQKLPVIKYALEDARITKIKKEEVAGIKIISNHPEWHQLKFADFSKLNFWNFKPHFGWAGHIEWQTEQLQ